MRHIIALALCAGLASCASWRPVAVTPQMVDATKIGVMSGMKDPSSAQFGDRFAAATTGNVTQVCGTVNGKNSFGAFVGSRTFSVQLNPQTGDADPERWLRRQRSLFDDRGKGLFDRAASQDTGGAGGKTSRKLARGFAFSTTNGDGYVSGRLFDRARELRRNGETRRQGRQNHFGRRGHAKRPSWMDDIFKPSARGSIRSAARGYIQRR